MNSFKFRLQSRFWVSPTMRPAQRAWLFIKSSNNMSSRASPLRLARTGTMRLCTFRTSRSRCSNIYHVYLFREVSSFSSVGFRLLYSPFSNILSIHYFTVNPYSLTEYKKAQNEISSFTESQTLSISDSRYTPGNGVFLQRMKAVCEGSRDFSQIEIENNISFRVTFFPFIVYSFSPKSSEWSLSVPIRRMWSSIGYSARDWAVKRSSCSNMRPRRGLGRSREDCSRSLCLMQNSHKT